MIEEDIAFDMLGHNNKPNYGGAKRLLFEGAI